MMPQTQSVPLWRLGGGELFFEMMPGVPQEHKYFTEQKSSVATDCSIRVNPVLGEMLQINTISL